MVIVNALDKSTEVDVLFFDSLLAAYDPRKRMHVDSATRRETNEMEITFLQRFLAAILTSLGLGACIPEIRIVARAYQSRKNCALDILKNIEYCIINWSVLIRDSWSS